MQALSLIKKDDGVNFRFLMSEYEFDSARQDRCLKFAMKEYSFESLKILLEKVGSTRQEMSWFQMGLERVLLRVINIGDLDLVDCFYPYLIGEETQGMLLNNALSLNETAIAKKFLNPELSISVKDSTFRNAIYNGNLEMMDLLMNNDTINDISFKDGSTCLEDAVNAGEIPAVLKLIDVCDVKAYSSRAFIQSVYRSNNEIIDLLYCPASFKHLMTHLDDEKEKILNMEERASNQFFKNLDHVGVISSKGNRRIELIEMFGEVRLPQTAALQFGKTLKKVLPKASNKTTKVRL